MATLTKENCQENCGGQNKCSLLAERIYESLIYKVLMQSKIHDFQESILKETEINTRIYHISTKIGIRAFTIINVNSNF